MVILSRGVPCVMAFHVLWYYMWRGISRTQISWYYTWRCPSRNPVACKSMVTRQIFKSHTLTFVCDMCKLTRVCEVIVELYRISKYYGTCVCNSIVRSEIWNKYLKCCIGSKRNFIRRSRVKLPISKSTRVVFIPNFQCYNYAIPC